MTQQQYEAKLLELLNEAKVELAQIPADQMSEENRQKMLDQIYGDLQLAENDSNPEFRKAAMADWRRATAQE